MYCKWQALHQKIIENLKKKQNAIEQNRLEHNKIKINKTTAAEKHHTICNIFTTPHSFLLNFKTYLQL